MNKKNATPKTKQPKTDEPVLFEKSYMQPQKGVPPYIYLIIFILAVVFIFGKKFILGDDMRASVAQEQLLKNDKNKAQKNR